MKLTKSKKGTVYSLTFEFSVLEALGHGVDITKWWNSSKLTDFVKILNDVTGLSQKRKSPFEELQEEMQRVQAKKERVRYQFSNDWNGFSATYEQVFTQSVPVREPAWCRVLELKRDATKDQIRIKYRELAKKHHPDMGGDAKKFAEITEAYEEALR